MIVASAVLTPIAVALLLVGIWRTSMPATLGALAAILAAGACLVLAIRRRRQAITPVAEQPSYDVPASVFPPLAPQGPGDE